MSFSGNNEKYLKSVILCLFMNDKKVSQQGRISIIDCINTRVHNSDTIIDDDGVVKCKRCLCS